MDNTEKLEVIQDILGRLAQDLPEDMIKQDVLECLAIVEELLDV